MSLSKQNPSPRSANAWWVPPAIFKPAPCSSACRAMSMVPWVMISSRAVSSGDCGKPILRCSDGLSCCKSNLSRYTSSCVSNITSRWQLPGLKKCEAVQVPSCKSCCGMSSYLSIGNRWFSGKGCA